MPPSPRSLADHGEEQELSALVDQAEERVRAKVGELPPRPSSPRTDSGSPAAFTIGLFVPTFYTYTAENFSNRMRPMSMVFADGIDHLGAAAAPSSSSG